jgi:hypothetical protein
MNASQKKNLRNLIVLVVLLAAVLGIVLAVNRSKAKKEAAQAASSAETAVTASGASYTALTYNNGTATLSFTANGDGTWSWADDTEFPLDSDYITKIVNTLSGLTPQQTITDGDTLDAYGLENPAMTLTATADDGTKTTVALGNATTDGNSYYMLLNGEESPVYIIAGDLHSELSSGIYDMMKLPTLPVLTADQISSITVTGKVSTTLTAQVSAAADSSAASSSASSSAGSGASVTWSCNGKDVTAQTDASSLVSEACVLTLNACKDYKPSAQAVTLCGLDSPGCTLTVSYTDKDGKDETLVLTVGGKATDGKSYYVRLKDDSTVYSMDASTISTILTVAGSGLSA